MKFIVSCSIFFFVGFLGTAQSSYISKLKSYEQFQQMSSLPLYQKYGQVQSLKVVFDCSDNRLHFVSSEDHEFHYEYCIDELGFIGSVSEFNATAYSGNSDRRFLLANINYYKALDTYTLELGPSDRMDLNLLTRFFWAVSEHVFFSDNLYLMVNTSYLKNNVDTKGVLPTIAPNEIYDGQVFQPIAKHLSHGKLRIIENWDSVHPSICSTDIIVVNDIPNVFPLVSGVIVIRFQTPLSHVTLLGQNRKIPICAYTNAFDSDYIRSFDGKYVVFSVEQDTFLIEESKIDFSEEREPVKRVKLKRDLSVDSLVPGRLLKERLSTVVGNKAANFGELRKYSAKIDFEIPESAFAIPFSFYQNHVDRSGVQIKIDDLIARYQQSMPLEELHGALDEIRTLILNSDLELSLLNEIELMILRLGSFRRMRFRSSTNAEDRKGFSGAGIYSSKTGEIYGENQSIANAVRHVWASLWSYNAFMEREAFNIDHSTVAMGVLVHRSFPDEEVNGVAITCNLYRDDFPGFVVNAQLGEVSVVQPVRGVSCDEFICYPDETTSIYGKQESGIDIINFSSLNGGRLVMTDEEIQHFANVLERIKQRYLRSHFVDTTYFRFALDVEFKLEHMTRQLYIKQMRIYNR